MEKFYCVTKSLSGYRAHEHDTEVEANAFASGIDFVGSDDVYTVGVYFADSKEEAIAIVESEDNYALERADDEQVNRDTHSVIRLDDGREVDSGSWIHCSDSVNELNRVADSLNYRDVKYVIRQK